MGEGGQTGKEKLEDLAHDVSEMKNKLRSVEKVKNENWFDTSQKMVEIENKFVEYEKQLNEKIREIKTNIFSNFTQNNFEVSNRNKKKMEIMEQQQRQLKMHLQEIERRIGKSVENKEE